VESSASSSVTEGAGSPPRTLAGRVSHATRVRTSESIVFPVVCRATRSS
jgi:hypothetical protein